MKLLPRTLSLSRLIRWSQRAPATMDVSSLTGSLVVGAALTFLAGVYAARELGAAGYGLAAIAMSFPGLVRSFISLKSTPVVVRLVTSFRTEGRPQLLLRAVRLGYSVDVVLAVVVVLIVYGTRHLVPAGSETELGDAVALAAVVYSLSFPFAALVGTSTAVLDAFGKFSTSARMQLAESAMTAAAIVGLLSTGTGWYGVVVGTAVGEALGGVIAWVLARRTLRMSRCKAEDGSRGMRTMDMWPKFRRELLGGLGWNYVLVSAAGVVDRLPIVVLGAVATSADAGFMRIASSIVAVSMYVEHALRRVVYPKLVAALSAGDGRSERELDIIRRWTKRAGFPLSVAVLLAVPLVPWAVRSVYGHEFSAMSDGLMVMLVGVAVSGLLFWRNPHFFAHNDFRLLALVFAGYALLFSAGSFLLGRWYGFSGIGALNGSGRAIIAIAISALAVARMRPDRIGRPPGSKSEVGLGEGDRLRQGTT
jgi:O-antigen/teichoic acid export membrane protein